MTKTSMSTGLCSKLHYTNVILNRILFKTFISCLSFPLMLSSYYSKEVVCLRPPSDFIIHVKFGQGKSQFKTQLRHSHQRLRLIGPWLSIPAFNLQKFPALILANRNIQQRLKSAESYFPSSYETTIVSKSPQYTSELLTMPKREC